MAALLGLSTWIGLSAQTTAKPGGASTSPAVKITKFFIGDPVEDSGYETGPLHIVYSDGTDIVERLPALKASTDKEVVTNAVGFSDLQRAEDGQTVGWTINYENCCTS